MTWRCWPLSVFKWDDDTSGSFWIWKQIIKMRSVKNKDILRLDDGGPKWLPNEDFQTKCSLCNAVSFYLHWSYNPSASFCLPIASAFWNYSKALQTSRRIYSLYPNSNTQQNLSVNWLHIDKVHIELVCSKLANWLCIRKVLLNQSPQSLISQ
jgi:hypothetical protein